jgi:hypothetical protein
MKKTAARIVVALLLLVSGVARADIDIQGTFNANGSFPIAYGSQVKGGTFPVADTTARDAIPSAIRAVGMTVYSVGDATTYQLIGGTANGNWSAVNSLPSQTGNSGKYLTTNGSAASWANTVTSVSTGNGLQGSITTTGTIDLRLNASGGLSKTLGGGSNELGIAAAGVSNAMLASSSLTVTAGTGLSGGGSISLGSSGSLAIDQSFTPTWTGLHTYLKTAVGTGISNALLIVNTTAAAVNAQQNSPSFRQEGRGWNLSSSEVAAVETWVRPVQGSTVTMEWVWGAQHAASAGAPTEMVKWNLDTTNSIGTLDFVATTGIVRTTSANSVLLLRGNPSDSAGNAALRLAGAAGVTYTQARIVFFDNPAGTAVAAVGPTGRFLSDTGFDTNGTTTLSIGTASATAITIGTTSISTKVAGGAVHRRRTVTADATLGVGDYILEVNKAGAAAITLPAGVDGTVYIVKDTSAAAGVNNITISGPQNVDGAASYVISTNRGFVVLEYNATAGEWSVIGKG